MKKQSFATAQESIEKFGVAVEYLTTTAFGFSDKAKTGIAHPKRSARERRNFLNIRKNEKGSVTLERGKQKQLLREREVQQMRRIRRRFGRGSY
jgi:hypothetical protein